MRTPDGRSKRPAPGSPTSTCPRRSPPPNVKLGNLNQATGRYVDAERAYMSAGAPFADLDLPEKVASCDMGLGVVYQANGQYEDAEQALKAARAAFADLNLPEQVATCNANLGNVYRARGQYEDAKQAYAAAVAVFPRHGVWETATRCDLNRGDLFLQERNHPGGHGRREVLARQALGLIVPTVLALDAGRFQFATTANRVRWAQTHVAAGFNIALRLAAELGDPTLLTNLIETSKTFGRLNLLERGDVRDIGEDLSAQDAAMPLLDSATSGATPLPTQPGTDPSTAGTAKLSAVLGDQAESNAADLLFMRLLAPGQLRLAYHRIVLTGQRATALNRYGAPPTTDVAYPPQAIARMGSGPLKRKPQAGVDQ
jgi:tetratricopeptide (TPR) repeat protein